MSIIRNLLKILNIDPQVLHSNLGSNVPDNSGWSSLQTVDGLIVEEFRYLLKYVSDGRLYSFDNIEALKEHKGDLLKSIEEELAKDTLPEELRGVSRATAERNLHNLRRVILGLTKD